ncbi:hypothetical protein [Paenibacillus thiaminolyticus]|uniref:hypothetical protein n=1 Tax=Paenibacillus thiaminolyticus TaxID=49283 RepID=UPI00160415A1|nr:hypothetical protein [Paenibacillus thiaminolyticus]
MLPCGSADVPYGLRPFRGEWRGADCLYIHPKSRSGVKRSALAWTGDRVKTLTLTDT